MALGGPDDSGSRGGLDPLHRHRTVWSDNGRMVRSSRGSDSLGFPEYWHFANANLGFLG